MEDKLNVTSKVHPGCAVKLTIYCDNLIKTYNLYEMRIFLMRISLGLGVNINMKY